MVQQANSVDKAFRYYHLCCCLSLLDQVPVFNWWYLYLDKLSEMYCQRRSGSFSTPDGFIVDVNCLKYIYIWIFTSKKRVTTVVVCSCDKLLLYVSACMLLRWEMAGKGCMYLNIYTSNGFKMLLMLWFFEFLPSLHQMPFVAKFCQLSSSSRCDWCNILKDCKHGKTTWDWRQKNQRGSVEPG